MGGADKKEFAPLLKPGLHPHTVEQVERLCVSRFPASLTRQSIMVNLRNILAQMQSQGMRGDVWVDGSFLTEKLNPDDVDLVLVVSGDEYMAMTPSSRNFFQWFSTNSLYDRYKCDNYGFVNDKAAEAEYAYAFWLRQFGFSRGQDMKGLAVIKLPFLVMP